MHIPNGAIVPFYIVSFVMLPFQYFRINPDRRVLNLRFLPDDGRGRAAVRDGLPEPNRTSSLVFFLLALFWLGLSL